MSYLVSFVVGLWWGLLVGFVLGLVANLETIGRVARWKRAIELGRQDDIIRAEQRSRKYG